MPELLCLRIHLWRLKITFDEIKLRVIVKRPPAEAVNRPAAAFVVVKREPMLWPVVKRVVPNQQVHQAERFLGHVGRLDAGSRDHNLLDCR